MASKRDLPSLLLLPFPPTPPTRHSLHAAYRPSIEAALLRLRNPERQARLVIAVAVPILQRTFVGYRCFSWDEAHSLIAALYALVAATCARHSMATEVDGGPGSVDATIFLVDHSRDFRISSGLRPSIEPNNTVIVDLPTFSLACHPWQYIFHVRTEAGLGIYNKLLEISEGRQRLVQQQLVPVEGGLTMNAAPSNRDGQQESQPTKLHSIVCLGGTFDHLHPGHKLLLTAGALLLDVPPRRDAPPSRSALLIIGITGDELLRRKEYAEYVQPWDERARSVLRFLSTLLHLSPSGWRGSGYPSAVDEADGDLRASFRDGTVTVQCVRIQDAYGPTITLEDIDVLVVSTETSAGGKAVNEKRGLMGWKALEVFEVNVLDAEELSDGLEGAETATQTEAFAAKISSTAIRRRRAERQAERENGEEAVGSPSQCPDAEQR